MIKALLLVFGAPTTWTRISETPRKWGFVFTTFLLPMVLLVCVAEGFGLVHWGRMRGQIPKLVHFSVPQAMVYEIGQFLLSMAIVFLGTKLIKSLAETFHGRNTFSQTFTVAAYGLSPYFLVRLADMHPSIPPWLIWAIGVMLTISVLYSGIPIILKPDPPHALGLYLMSSLFLTILTGLARFVTIWYLSGKFGKLDAFISRFL